MKRKKVKYSTLIQAKLLGGISLLVPDLEALLKTQEVSMGKETSLWRL